MADPHTPVLAIEPLTPDPAVIERAATVIRRGGLVAFPTETVYGLGANALDETAVRRIFAAKERAADDPLIVHIAEPGDVSRVAREVTTLAAAFATAFWPGPLTLVLPRAPGVAPAVSAGLDTVAARCPAHPVAHALIAAAGVPIAAPSANRFTRTSATTAAHIIEDLDGRIDLILDGGQSTVGVESTVVRVEGLDLRVLRPGAITLGQLRAIAGPLGAAVISGPGGAGPAPSPGMMAKHYAPRKPFTLFAGEAARERLRAFVEARVAAGSAIGLLLADEDAAAFRDIPGVTIASLGPAADDTEAAHRVFAALRALDAGPSAELAALEPPPGGLRDAVIDRLRRAASTLAS